MAGPFHSWAASPGNSRAAGSPIRVYVQSSDELTLRARLNGQRRDHRAGKLDPAKGKKLNELLPGWRQGPGHRGGRRKPKGPSAASQGESARDPSRSMTLTGWPAPFKPAGCAPPARRQTAGPRSLACSALLLLACRATRSQTGRQTVSSSSAGGHAAQPSLQRGWALDASSPLNGSAGPDLRLGRRCPLRL